MKNAKLHSSYPRKDYDAFDTAEEAISDPGGCEVLWTVRFNPMVYESCAATISVHWTKKGAVEAMRKFKELKFTDPDWRQFSHMWSEFSYGKIKVQE